MLRFLGFTPTVNPTPTVSPPPLSPPPLSSPKLSSPKLSPPPLLDSLDSLNPVNSLKSVNSVKSLKSVDSVKSDSSKQNLLNFAIAAKQGYKKFNTHTSLLHTHLEDVASPNNNFNSPILHPSGFPYHLLLLADGHGGINAPTHFVNSLRSLTIQLLNSKDWSWHLEHDRIQFAQEITNTFQQLDLDWCKAKVNEFQHWQADPSLNKPIDDGCTLVVNILHKNHLINVNVGDSRTILARRIVLDPPKHVRTPSISSNNSTDSTTLTNPTDCESTASTNPPNPKWVLHFASQDHSPDHPVAAWHVASRNGIFINEDGSRRLAKVVHPSERMQWEPFCCCCVRNEAACGRPHNVKSLLAEKRYHQLLNSRIYRPPTPFIRQLGIPHLKTLNLAATMGDVLFKLDGGVISSRPDVTFVELHPRAEHLLLFASDGLWDHLRWQANPAVANTAKPCGTTHSESAPAPSTSQLQNERVLEWTCARLDAWGVQGVADALCERETDEAGTGVAGISGPRGAAGDDGVYWPWCARFDDVTVGVVHMRPGAV